MEVMPRNNDLKHQDPKHPDQRGAAPQHRPPHPVTLTAALREQLELVRLTPAQRQKYQGRWFLNAGDFASRAASVRESYPELLEHLPFASADIEAQRQRVARLEAMQIVFARFNKDLSDTLLQERAALVGLSTSVLREVEELARSPFRALEHKLALAASVELLRKDFDRRNKNVSKAKRARRAAPAPAGGLPARRRP